MKNKPLTEQEYDNIKQLTGLLGTSKVAEITKRSRPTVSNIKRSDTYQEYRAIIKSYAENRKTEDIFSQFTGKAAESVRYEVGAAMSPFEPIDVTIPSDETAGASDTDRIVAALGAINTSILKLVDACEAKSEKKGWLK